MKIYISGGAKNGKSTLAQSMASQCARHENVAISPSGEVEAKNLRKVELPLYYIATMIPTDAEDRNRIARHVRERAGLGFTTIERAKNIRDIVASSGTDEAKDAEEARKIDVGEATQIGCCDSSGVYLLDSVTALLANVMFPAEENGEGWFNPNAAEEVAEDLKSFLEKVDNAILVSDYIYADPRENMSKDRSDTNNIDYTDIYMKGLAHIDRNIAKLCDELIEVSSGIPTRYKI